MDKEYGWEIWYLNESGDAFNHCADNYCGFKSAKDALEDGLEELKETDFDTIAMLIVYDMDEWHVPEKYANIMPNDKNIYVVYFEEGEVGPIQSGKDYCTPLDPEYEDVKSIDISESTNIFESFLGNRQKGGFDSAKVIRNLKDGRYDSEKVISACVSALEDRQKSALAHKLVKQLQSDGILAKVFKRSGEFGTKEQ